MNRPSPGPSGQGNATEAHALVVPVYGIGGHAAFEALGRRVREWCEGVDLVVLVDNNVPPDARLDHLACSAGGESAVVQVWRNGNRGGLAGGFNLGTARALDSGATLITLLDQDSELDAQGLRGLGEPWRACENQRLVVGPMVLNEDSGRLEAGVDRGGGVSGRGNYRPTRLLISSGTTFRAVDHAALGPLHEGLFIDFLDHIWCFRARRKGFQLIQHPGVVLRQRFGDPHPHVLCRRLGMHLYSPRRHYYALRNLRWLCQQVEVPADIKLKEVLKMLIKPWLWMLCEPRRRENARAVWAGLTDSLPGPHP